MKYFLFISLFLIASLNPYSAMAGSCCSHSTETTEQASSCESSITESDVHSCPASNGDKDCSGECGCVCCTSIVLLLPLTDSSVQTLSTPDASKVTITDIDYAFEISSAIWNPPQPLC